MSESPPSVTAPVAVLVNPDAGSRPTAALALQSVLGNRGFAREVRTPEALREFAHSARQGRVAIVAICGGDGTLGRVVTAICSEYGEGPLPSIAPLGGGTMNTIARSLGLRRLDPVRQLEAVVDGRDVERGPQGTMVVNGARIGFMLGAGVPSRFLELYEQGRRLGAVRAARVIGELLLSALAGGGAAERLFAPVSATVSVDGRDVGLRQLSLLYAASIDEIGLGFRPTPRARDRLGAFQVLAAAARAMDLVRVLPRVWWSGGVGDPAWLDACVEEFIVAFGEPTAYMVDGDLEPPVAELEVRAGPIVEMLVARRV
jgi:diacylglycerol kinase family enzyme